MIDLCSIPQKTILSINFCVCLFKLIINKSVSRKIVFFLYIYLQLLEALLTTTLLLSCSSCGNCCNLLTLIGFKLRLRLFVGKLKLCLLMLGELSWIFRVLQGIWCGELAAEHADDAGDDEYEKREFVEEADGEGVLVPESGDSGERGLDAMELDADSSSSSSSCVLRNGHSSASLNFRRQSKKTSRLGSENAGDG